MKWAIVGLFALGVVAAIAAAILVASMGRPAVETETPEEVVPDVEVVVAAMEMPALTILSADSVTTRSVKRNIAPLGHFQDPIQVIGKVLLADVQEGQVQTAEDFAVSGSPAELAAALRPGERAVNVSLTDSMGVENLLYPGSTVDVLVTMKLEAGEASTKEPVTLTLLEAVRVLAVGQKTIVSPGEEPETAGGQRGPRPSVSLAVSPEQAEKLKLAMQEGSVSLTLSNPSDSSTEPARLTGWPALSPLLGGPKKELQAQRSERQVLVLRGGAAEVRTFTQATGGGN
jgi:pilus assembly protein CpaB